MSELFKSYEIIRVPYFPKVLRVIGGSVIFHFVLLMVVIYVPAVRDAVNVAGIFGGAKFVDKAYKKTTIGDDVDVIDLAGSDRFEYPEGYFSTTEPLPDPMAPVIIEQASNFPVAMPTPMPTPFPTPVPMPVVKPMTPSGFPPGINPNTHVATRGKNGKNPAGIPDRFPLDPAPTPTPDPIASDPQVANQQADQVAQTSNINRPHDDEINRAPLKDFVSKANDLYDKGLLDFSKPIEVVIDTELDKDAHFANANVISKSGNAQLDDISKDMVAALSDSGALKFLMGRDGSTTELTKMRFTIKMDQNSFNAVIEAEAPSAERARQMANGYSLLLGAVPALRQGKDDEIAIAKGTTIRADGTKLIANFSMPRQQAIDLMKKQVAANKKPET
jgi:hypothetical protein